MKTLLLLLMLIPNVCYGQTTATFDTLYYDEYIGFEFYTYDGRKYQTKVGDSHHELISALWNIHYKNAEQTKALNNKIDKLYKVISNLKEVKEQVRQDSLDMVYTKEAKRLINKYKGMKEFVMYGQTCSTFVSTEGCYEGVPVGGHTYELRFKPAIQIIIDLLKRDYTERGY